uniref:DNA-directed primase/polymerase protein n=1 Tax=Magallana gigas TaxID=29159 RepID=K1QM17_MAGGI
MPETSLSESAVEDASCCGDDGVLDNVRKKSQISDRVLGHFTKEQLSSLIVRNKHGEKTSFCDIGVYTKNRNFRMYLSSKYGKNNPLLVAAENEFVPLSSMNDEAIFMDSLIANVKFVVDLKKKLYYQKCHDPVCKSQGFKSSDFQSEDCFIIDHVTIFNSHYLDRIKEIVAGRIDKFILIEAGFTASAHTAEYDCGKELQLDEENFLKIWNGSLKSLGCQDHALSQKGKEVYDVFSKRFLVTPRLLHGVLDYMYSFRCIGKTVQQALARYTKQTREEIVHFKGCGDNEQYAQFLLHTTILLEHIPDEGEYIFTEKQATKILIAINIFETEYCIVTKDELDSNIELSELDLKEGDNFVKVRHLQPYLADAWRQRLPYHLQFVLENASDEIFTIMFRNGEAGKEFEKMLVEIQRNQGTLTSANFLGYFPLSTILSVSSVCDLWLAPRPAFSVNSNTFLYII